MVKKVLALILTISVIVSIPFGYAYSETKYRSLPEFESTYAGGNGFSFFIDENDTLYGMGANDYGQLGIGNNEFQEEPVRVMNNVRSVYAGDNHTLVIDKNNNLYAFGSNRYGQLGDGTNQSRNKPVKIMENVKTASLGEGFSLVIDKRRCLYSFGKNNRGQLGDGTKKDQNKPVKIKSRVKRCSAGLKHALFLKMDNTLYGFGDNSMHQLGFKRSKLRSRPTKIMKRVYRFSAGATHSLVVKTNNRLYGFGNNYHHQISNSSTLEYQRPTYIAKNIEEVESGFTASIWRGTTGAVKLVGKIFSESDDNSLDKLAKNFHHRSYSDYKIGFNDNIYILKPTGKLVEITCADDEIDKTELTDNVKFPDRYIRGNKGQRLDFEKAKALNDLAPYSYNEKGEFNPRLYRKLKSAEAIALIGKVLNWQVDKDVEPTFTDVPKWSIPYVEYAKQNSICTGLSDTILGNDNVSVERLFIWVMTAMGEDAADVHANQQKFVEKYNIKLPHTTYRNDLVKLLYDVLKKEGKLKETESTDVNWAIKTKQKTYDTALLISDIKKDTKKFRIKSTDKLIAITFDDGPSAYTDKLLDELKEYNAKCTFFVLGSCAKNNKEKLLRMKNEGHEIANHSYTHPNLRRLSRAGIANQIDSCDNVVREHTGLETTMVRPPYGAFNSVVKDELIKRDKSIIMWSVDTLDWKYKNASYVRNYVINHAGDGEIVLLHDIHPTTVEGFISALPVLVKKGYKLVTVSELMKHRRVKLEAGKVYFSPQNYR